MHVQWLMTTHYQGLPVGWNLEEIKRLLDGIEIAS